MDGLQPIDRAPRPIVATIHAQPMAALPAKAPGDYVRALRRRCWLMLLLAVPVATAGTLFVLRMTPVYSVSAQILIDPPRIDPKVSGMIGHGDAAADSGKGEHYVPNAMAVLVSKALVDKVLKDASLELPQPSEDDVADLIGRIKTRPLPKSQHWIVTLEGADRDRLARILNLLLLEFKAKIKGENDRVGESVEDFAKKSIRVFRDDLKRIDGEIQKLLETTPSLAPGGRNLLEIQLAQIETLLLHEESRLGQIAESIELDSLVPRSLGHPGGGDPGGQIASLERERLMLQRRQKHQKGIVRDGFDPALKKVAADLRDVDLQIAELKAAAAPPGTQGSNAAAEALLARRNEKIAGLYAKKQDVLDRMKTDMPKYQEYLATLRERDLKEKQIAAISTQLNDFHLLSDTQKPPVTIVGEATEPLLPIRPRKTVYIAGCILFSVALGVALVCFLEYLDNSVKVPEHLTAGLALPLFGVVPRIRREARNHRGGHLWTHGTPDSVEADAYRNLRASLLGAGSQAAPILTLLVTSAKAGEGKSTTALNLAATCARAGERTLLIDVDLRRPSLVEVFPPQEHGHGLVDVLRGDLPWQKTVVQSEIPNLDFLPTGDTRDVPIEVLGSLELRQLLLSLSQHHYDRVILDGPAVLGLADCRMLGRVVDASILVVRAGAQGLRPLQRAKTMLEQSQVQIAGVVFNGLSDDLQNWSSYGPNVVAYPTLDSPRAGGGARGLGGPGRNPGQAAASTPALVAAGSAEA